MSDNSFESILSMITSNPDLVNKISSTVKDGGDNMEKTLSNVISLISNSQNSSNDSSDDVIEKKEEISQKTDTPASKIEKLDNFSFDNNKNSFLMTLSKSISKNSALLLALKPYLSKERCEMIDNVVKISQLASIMNLAK